MQNPLVRRVWPAAKKRSDVYRRLVALDKRTQFSARLDRWRGRPPREDVIQDVEVPVERLPDFLDFFHREVGMSPVWLCPLRAQDKWPLYPLDPGRTYVNVGFWGTVPIRPGRLPEHHNRLIEREVARLDGHKSLYSTAYYTRDDFWRHYDGDDLPPAEGGIRPGRAVAGSLRQNGTRQVIMRLAEVFERVVGRDAHVEFLAYDGSRAGPAGADVTVNVRSPYAISYLAHAPGALGLARAYVAGYLDVSGDMYTALNRMQSAIGDMSLERQAHAPTRHRPAIRCCVRRR